MLENKAYERPKTAPLPMCISAPCGGLMAQTNVRLLVVPATLSERGIEDRRMECVHLS